MSDQVDKITQTEVPSLEAILKANVRSYDQGLNKWNVTATYSTRQCTACHEVRGVQHFVRSAAPYGRLETNRAGCNTCKFRALNNGFTREDFSRIYLGFEGVWDVTMDEAFYAGLCPDLWIPKKEKKYYAGTKAKLWSGHTDGLVQAKLDAKFGPS